MVETISSALQISDLEHRDAGPVVATARLGDRGSAIFLVRPDARRRNPYNFVDELTKTIRECGVGDSP